MLVGMALFKWGVLSAQRSNLFYRVGMTIGFLFGLPLVITGVVTNFHNSWSYGYSMFFGSQFNYWGSLGVSLGYICAVMLVVKTKLFTALVNRLAAVGRMALTNYLTQSICALIFYGLGLGLFGRVERIYHFSIVAAIWALQLWWSPIYLKRNKFGPFEWLWRSLSYMKRVSK